MSASVIRYLDNLYKKFTKNRFTFIQIARDKKRIWPRRLCESIFYLFIEPHRLHSLIPKNKSLYNLTKNSATYT